MKEDTLTDMVEHMTEKVGLVHQLPVMMDGDLPFSRVVEKVSQYHQTENLVFVMISLETITLNVLSLMMNNDLHNMSVNSLFKGP